MSLSQIELILGEPDRARDERELAEEMDEKRYAVFDAIVLQRGILPIELTYIPPTELMEQISIESSGEVFIPAADLPSAITEFISTKLGIE